MSKISGPLLDRIDLHVEVTPVSYDELASNKRGSETSEEITQRVIQARSIQETRFEERKDVFCNAQMPSNMVRKVCELDTAGNF